MMKNFRTKNAFFSIRQIFPEAHHVQAYAVLALHQRRERN